MRSPLRASLVLACLVPLMFACGGGDSGEGDPLTPEDPGTMDPGTNDPGTTDTTSTGSEKPDTLPHLDVVGLYSASSPFNTPVPDNATVDAGSAAMVGKLVAAGDLVLTWRQYSSPVWFADASTPRVSVSLECGPVWEMGVSKMDGVPIPPWAEASNDGDGTNPPVGCGEESDQDNHMVVLDLTNRCEYDLWQARTDGTAWSASWGNSISLDSDGVYPHGLSTRGSGFAFPGGLIWPDELKAGEIRHALAMSYPYTRSGGPVAPATDSDGITDGSDAIPEGALLQLDPTLDLEALGLTGWELTIGRALQTYGVYMVDTGGESGVGLYAIDPRSAKNNPYAGVLPDEAWPKLSHIPMDAFRVITLPAQQSDWESGLDLVASGCGSIS